MCASLDAQTRISGAQARVSGAQARVSDARHCRFQSGREKGP
jgi:hypothetical protein